MLKEFIEIEEFDLELCGGEELRILLSDFKKELNNLKDTIDYKHHFPIL